MANIAKLEFTALDISGKNYLSWVQDATIHLTANDLGKTIEDGNTESLKDCCRALIFIRRHIHEELKSEYLTVNDPLTLWKCLTERFDQQRSVILPKARHDWLNLRLQDFKSVGDYNSALHKITSQLKLCGDKVTDYDMLEKTFSTFHASNMLLQQQYRAKEFKRYSDLISCLLVAEQNNELLLKMHESRPTGSVSFPEANAAHRGHRNGQGQWKGRPRFNYHKQRGNYRNVQSNKIVKGHQKWNDKKRGKYVENNTSKEKRDNCYRCGKAGHWTRTCRTPKHLVEIYQSSQKGEDKNVEINFLDRYEPEPDNMTQFDSSDFFGEPSGNGDDLMVDDDLIIDENIFNN